MLYIIGLGLYDEKDISLKGLKALEKCEKIFAEFYTAKLQDTSLSSIKKMLGKDIKILKREGVEEEMLPLHYAQDETVAFLVAGDPLIATTHLHLILEAKERGINTRVIHSSSIISAAPGLAGLQAYKFGKTTTIPFPEKNYFPHTPYIVIRDNLRYDAHTLVLLDIKAEEDKYMSANEGLDYLLKIEEERKEGVTGEDSLAIVIARAGAADPLVKADRIGALVGGDFGEPLHCIIIPASLHFIEAEYLIKVCDAPKDIVKEMIT